MEYKKFVYYNALGGLAWVSGFTLLGYFFGNIPIIKENFSITVFVIIGISVLPMLYEFVKSRLKKMV